MIDPIAAEIVAVNQKLLESIATGDWNTYVALCDPTLSCFEPEARGHLVQGLEFHRFYFDLGAPDSPRTTTMASPHVRIIGTVAIVSYIRLTQRLDPSGAPITTQMEETRVWRREEGAWRHVHFHRSPCE